MIAGLGLVIDEEYRIWNWVQWCRHTMTSKLVTAVSIVTSSYLVYPLNAKYLFYNILREL